MFIWGTKITRKRVGWVADFCPLCRGLRPFRLLRVGSASHIWYLPLGYGQFVGNEIACGICDAVYETDGSRYRGISEDLVDVDELVRRTLPASDGRVQELIAREARVAQGRLGPDERATILREVIAHGAHQVERQVRDRIYPPKGRLVGWATFGLCALWVLCGPRLPRIPQAILGGFFAAGLLACLYYMFTCVGQHVRSAIEPAVARGLAPLEPTEEEIRDAIGQIRAVGSGAAKKLSPARLRHAIEAAEPLRPR